MVELRLARPEDMPELERVLGPNQTHFYRARMIQDALILSAWHNDEPIGAVCLSFEPAQEPQVAALLPDAAMLYRLHVDKDLRDRGHGTGLLRWAEEKAAERGYTKIAVGVDIDNDRGMNLYRRIGYDEWDHGEVDTVRETYSQDGRVETVSDRCLIFVKDLA